MEEQLVRLLADTQSNQEQTRRNAEIQLRQCYGDQSFPLALVSLASHKSIPLDIRQAALLYCKTFVLSSWSPNLDDFKGQVFVDDQTKKRVRQSLLELATSDVEERKIKSAASIVVGKIASADFPDEWPDLLPTLLRVIPTATDGQLHGALKVLLDLVDDSLNEEQFFKVARDLVQTVHGVAIDEQRRPTLRALAVSVFRSCFDTLEMIMEDHKAAVKAFAEETLSGWSPFFIATLKTRLPAAPEEDDEPSVDGSAEYYRGMVALKLQVVKILMRVRNVFPAVLAPQTPQLFSATWEELSILQPEYHRMYIEDDEQSRLEDADGLPYTLDFLVLEELDFMQACLRASPVKKELDRQLKAQTAANGNVSGSWVTEVMKLVVAYAQITTEEEGLWDIDVNIFLSEEANVTANYTPRTACGDLVIKLGESLQAATVEGLLIHTKTLYAGESSWKLKEAALYILNQLLGDFQDVDRSIGADAANQYIECIKHAMQQEDTFLRARGYLVAGSLTRTSGDALLPIATAFLETSLHALTNDDSEVVQVSCIRALQYYVAALPSSSTLPLQSHIISCLSHFLTTQDLNDLTQSEDIMIAVVETLRDVILLDPQVCLTGGGLDLLFTLASHGATNFQLAMLVTETFEEVTNNLSGAGVEAYAQLCGKVLPSLTGAFDVATLTEENALTNLAAELLAVLSANGSTPLPQGIVSTVMPKLERILLNSQDEELLKSATTSVKSMIEHDADQVFAWQDGEGRGGLEVTLIIIDRLLGPNVDDHAAEEVGGLAAELVEKAGSERLGPYLTQLLRAVAIRLATATAAHLIQSLVLVFARLSLISAREVVDFLASVQIGDDENGLHVVLTKWLEYSINFAGYDEIRQNVIALSKLYELQDPRLDSVHVKGDLVTTQSSRIMTRSRARQNPDQYTIIPAPLKIIKVLVEELLLPNTTSGTDEQLKSALKTASSTTSKNKHRDSSNANGQDELDGDTLDNDNDQDNDNDNDDDDEEGDDWEDEDDDPTDFLDLGLGATKEMLMAYGDEIGDDGREMARRIRDKNRDDETQGYLLAWFRGVASTPGFGEVFASLSANEQEKLRVLNGQ